MKRYTKLFALLFLFSAFSQQATAQPPCSLAGQWQGDTVVMRTPASRSTLNQVRQWEAERAERLRAQAMATFSGTDSTCWLYGLNLAFDDRARGVAARYRWLSDSTLQLYGAISTTRPEGQLLNAQSVTVVCTSPNRFAIQHEKDGKLYWVVFRRVLEPLPQE
jgi:hypothetical protein